MALVRLLSTAEADSDAIVRHLSREAGVAVASRYLAQFEDAYEQLARFPESGARRMRLGPAVRCTVVPPFLILYEYERSTDVVRIARILHGKRRLTGALLNSTD